MLIDEDSEPEVQALPVAKKTPKRSRSPNESESPALLSGDGIAKMQLFTFRRENSASISVPARSQSEVLTPTKSAPSPAKATREQAMSVPEATVKTVASKSKSADRTAVSTPDKKQPATSESNSLSKPSPKLKQLSLAAFMYKPKV